MSNLSNIGYITHYMGLPGDLIECKTIILIKKLEPITIYNLQEIYSNISEIPYKILQKNTEGYFNLSQNTGGFEFNTILYINFDRTKAIGFTTFGSIQSFEITPGEFIKNLYISIELTSRKGEIVDISLSNSLDGALQKTRTDLGFLENKYTKNLEVGDSYIRYTNRVKDTQQDPSLIMITDSISYVNNEAYLFSLKNGIILNDYDIEYNKYSLGILNEDLVIYLWNNQYEYKVVSIRDGINDFNIPTQIYYKGKIPYISSSLIFNYVSNKFFIFTEIPTQFKVLYDLELRKWIYPNSDCCIDPFDSTGTLKFYPVLTDLSVESELNISYTELYGLAIDLRKTTGIVFLRKTNNWFIFKYIHPIHQTIEYIYSNSNGVLHINEDEVGIPINSRCIMVKTIKNGIDFIDFYFFSSGNFILSDLVYSDRKNTPKVFPIYNGIPIYTNIINGEDNLSNYSNRLIISSPKENGLRSSQVFDGLRRNSLELTNIPNIIDSFGGILFYIEDSKLKYL